MNQHAPSFRIRRSRRIPPRATAFTLIEILIVVVILGILAAIVVPQFSNASYMTRENTLKDDLRYLRTQVLVFKAQHRDVAPGYPAGNTAGVPTEADFLQQLTKYTDEKCGVSDVPTATHRFGPYLQKMPPNPLSGLDTPGSIKIIANGQAIPAADETTGWVYKPQTQEVAANTAGADHDGTRYADY